MSHDKRKNEEISKDYIIVENIFGQKQQLWKIMFVRITWEYILYEII